MRVSLSISIPFALSSSQSQSEEAGHPTTFEGAQQLNYLKIHHIQVTIMGNFIITIQTEPSTQAIQEQNYHIISSCR
jgi:hypothetical protein